MNFLGASLPTNPLVFSLLLGIKPPTMRHPYQEAELRKFKFHEAMV